MKRIFAVVFSIVLMVGGVAFAEDGSLVQWTDDEFVLDSENITSLYLLRPRVSLNNEKGRDKIADIYFGEELTLLSQEGDYCKVSTQNGQCGYVETGYIGYAMYKIYLGSGGVPLAYKAGLCERDFGSAAGGKRYNEEALVLFEEGDYLYIVTDEGCSGYVNRYNPNISYDNWLKRWE